MSILCQACQLETDASAVSAYIIFLSQYTLDFEIQELDGLVLVFIYVTLLCSSTLINVLLQTIEYSLTFAACIPFIFSLLICTSSHRWTLASFLINWVVLHQP